MALIELQVPDIGDFKDVEVIEVLVKPGDTVATDQSLITIESDKASMEIPSTGAGVIKELKVKIGDKINQGMVIATAESGGDASAAAAQTAAAPSKPMRAPEAAAKDAASPAPAPSPASSGGGSIDATVPDIGDFKDVEVIEVLVKVGDTVAADQSLVTIESDKASMEIPSSAAGVVKELKVKVGDKINRGDLLAILEGGGGTSAAARPADAPPPAAQAGSPKEPSNEAPAAEASPSAGVPATSEAVPPVGDQTLAHASPSVRKFARELGVDLNRVKGSGPKDRVTQEDVQGFVKAALTGGGPKSAPAAAPSGSGFGAGWPAWPSLDFSKFGPTEILALSRIQKLSGPNLARNWASIPHVTQFDEADITELEEFRKSTNETLAKKSKDAPKVTMLAFVMKSCVAALKQFPRVNSSLDADGANLILKQYYHLGFAADTPNGLVVPVIRDVDRKGIAEIAKETGELAAQARAGKLGPAAMQGASFTISSLGGVGGTFFTPIINAPEVAILGLSKSDHKPKWNGSSFEPRLMLPLSLSYDHRVIDGAQAARFTTYLSEVLADMRRVLL
ncbi:MAG: dihydrolipoyllysine-residue acetyltransferase [Burkholderiaceae bacterium]